MSNRVAPGDPADTPAFDMCSSAGVHKNWSHTHRHRPESRGVTMNKRILGAIAALSLVSTLAAGPAGAQESADGLWSAEQPLIAARKAGPATPTVYRLNQVVLERVLTGAPQEGAVLRGAGARLSVPTPDGHFIAFRIEESSVMAPELARKYPEIATFRGQGAEDPSATVRLSRTSLGFLATVVSADGVFMVAPESREDTSRYVSRRIEGELDVLFECLAGAFAPEIGKEMDFGPIVALGLAPAGTQLRTYQLAVAATGEYTDFFDGTVPTALAAIASTVNAINAIYEVEVAVRMVLVADNDAIIYTDPATDPFPLANKNSETQAAIDAEIGDANYDIGHLFHVQGASISGNAGCIACVCASGSKGSGWSQGPDPTGGDYLFVVSHEMGHQYGGTHTFNGSSCSASQYTASSAWEPGSGSTLMSYSSICGADNVLGAQVGDLYFHAGSRQQITTYTQTGGGNACAAVAATGNGIPVVDAGADYTIPRGTPFELTAGAADPDGDALTYTWEQFDLGLGTARPLSAVDDGELPLFRSFPPSSNPTRTFPDFDDLLAGTPNLFPNKLGEQLPSTDRILTFRATARDNRAGGGGGDDDEVVLTVEGAPFEITAPLAGGGLECKAPSNISWNVGGGSVAPTVDVRLSTNGGATFPTVLAAGTANDGALTVNGPDTLTNDARLRIDAVGNVFFALTPQIAVEDTLDPTVTCPPPVQVECTGNNGIEKSDPVLVAFFGGASASDACDASVTPVDNAPVLIPLGVNPITFSATDDSSNTGSCSANIKVVDTTAPIISVSVSPTTVFPAPNHKLFEVNATVTYEDGCDPNPTVKLTSITSNEPDNGLGDGDTTADIQGADVGTADFSFLLRAERSGRGQGRIYTVTYTVTDGSGNTSSASANVTIPKSASH